MTDRHAGYIVTLEKDIREDDAEAVIEALRMIKGVLNVQPVVSDLHTQLAESRVAEDYQRKFLDFFKQTFR